jgi:hypothetical protein
MLRRVRLMRWPRRLGRRPGGRRSGGRLGRAGAGPGSGRAGSGGAWVGRSLGRAELGSGGAWVGRSLGRAELGSGGAWVGRGAGGAGPESHTRRNTGCVDGPGPWFLGSRTSSRMRGHLVTRHGALVLRGRGTGTLTRRSCGPGSDRPRIRVRLTQACRAAAPPRRRATPPGRWRQRAGHSRVNDAIGRYRPAQVQKPMRRL